MSPYERIGLTVPDMYTKKAHCAIKRHAVRIALFEKGMSIHEICELEGKYAKRDVPYVTVSYSIQRATRDRVLGAQLRQARKIV